MKTIQIQNTKDYNLFEIITGNRNVNQKKIERIVNDINSGLNLLPYCPIIVYKENDKYLIVDGQHRFEVSMRVDSPVFFVVTEKLSLQQIAMLNSRQDKWTQTDFLKCYIKIGIEDYITLENVLKKYKIGISTGIELLMNGKITKNNNQSQNFKDGKFKVLHYHNAIELLDLSHSLFDAYRFYTDRYLLNAIQQIKDKGLCDFDILKDKIKRNPMMMDKQGTPKDYIYNIERVYNAKNSIRQIIF